MCPTPASDVEFANAPNLADRNPIQGFASRNALKTWWTSSGGAAFDGQVVSAGGYAYQAVTGATAISDLPGLLPFGQVYPDHWRQNETPGTTDMTAAFVDAVTYVGRDPASGQVYLDGGAVWLSNGMYAVTTVEITRDNVSIRGAGVDCTQIVSLSPTDDVIRFGNGQTRNYHHYISDLSIVVKPSTNRTSGAHLRFWGSISGGWDRVNVYGFYDGIVVEGCAHLHGTDTWFRGRGRTTISNAALSFKSAIFPVGLINCTGCHMTRIEGVASNQVAGGFVEHGIYIASSDGLYFEDIHFNLPKVGMTIEPQGANFIGEIRISGFYFDKSYVRNVQILGSTTDLYGGLMFTSGIMRAAGGGRLDITDPQATSLYISPDSTVDNVSLSQVTFAQARGRAIEVVGQNVASLSVENCTFEDINSSNNPGFSEVTLDGPGINYTGNIHINGDPSGVCMTVSAGATQAFISGNDTNLSSCGTVFADSGNGTRYDSGPQQHPVDTEAGRVMTIGAFGIGGQAIDVSDYDGLTASGIYTNAIAATGAPNQNALYCVLHSEAGNRAVQIASRNGNIWSRWRVGRGADDWENWEISMRNGSFGIGGAAIDVPDYDALAASGVYTNTGTATTGAPETDKQYFVLHSEGGNRAAQTATRNGNIWARWRAGTVGTTWTAWNLSNPRASFVQDATATDVVQKFNELRDALVSANLMASS